jgi:hypothetical protein
MPKITLTLELETESGHLKVTGPLQMKTLCYGMLETAKDQVREFHERAKKEAETNVEPVRLFTGEFHGKEA